MPKIERNYPSAWAQRMAPAVTSRAKKLETHRVIQKLLQQRSVASVDDLNPLQQAEILVDLMFWQITAEYEAERARDEAYRDALEAAIEDFSVE